MFKWILLLVFALSIGVYQNLGERDIKHSREQGAIVPLKVLKKETREKWGIFMQLSCQKSAFLSPLTRKYVQQGLSTKTASATWTIYAVAAPS